MIDLFNVLWCFLEIGFFSIGGGYATIPLIQEKAIMQHQYISMSQFTDIITFSQMTPGPLAVNLSTFTGFQIGGIFTAIVTTLGCVISGILISYALHRFFQSHKHNACIYAILHGLKAASVGLILSSFITILGLTLFPKGTMEIHNLDIIMLLLFLCCSWLIRKRHFTMPAILGLCACLGVVRCFIITYS